MSRMLQIGIVGFGKIGRIHWRHLTEMSGVQVSAVADRSSDWRGDLPPTVCCFEEWKELIALPDLDAVVICLPHSLHVECAEAAMRDGKHVFIEKPLATTLEGAKKLVATAGETARRLMVNMTHRFYPPLLRARELLGRGEIGEVISVRDYYMEAIVRSEFPAWFFDPVVAGGGVALTDSIHLVDRVSWLLGEPLRFVGGTSRNLYPDSEVEDCAEILCNSRSGIPVTIGSFFFSGPKVWEDGLTIFGTKGVMTIQAWSHVEWRSYGGGTRREEGYGSLEMESRPLVGHRAALGDFVASIREGKSSGAEGASVLSAQEVIDSFYQFTKADNE